MTFSKKKRRTPKSPHAVRQSKRSTFLFWRYILRIILIGSIWLIIGVGSFVLLFSQGLPDLKTIQMSNRNPSVIVQTFSGTVLGTYGDLFEEVIKVEDLPPYVPQALMAVEDKRFYNHFGIDIIGLIRAMYANYRAHRVVQGGSTLTQQLAKNILFTQGIFNINDRSYRRKIQEVLLAIWLEFNFTKDQILTLYLNRVYFGSGTYGIDAASQKYFNKSARNLTVFEAAVVAGLLKAPSKYSPAHHPEKAKERAKIVLDLMVSAGFINESQSYLEQGAKELSERIKEHDHGTHYFADWIYETLPQIIGPINKDLIVITTLDIEMQKHADYVCKYYNKTMGQALKATEVAFVAMSPQGSIKAMVGGRDYNDSQFNRATQALRQPGSAFKTIIYQAALEMGMTPDTLIEDSPISIGDWHPSNYKWKSRGMITLKEGLTYSVNSVAIRLTQQATPQKVAEVAKRLGITSKMTNDLSISLGSCETTLLELLTVHATYANQGQAVWPYGILEIRDKSGNILYRHPNQSGRQIINTPVLNNMREMLRAVVEEGSGRASNVDSYTAGKTGSNGNRDAWFFTYREKPIDDFENEMTGYKDIVVGVWVGNDNNAPMAPSSTGGRIPTRIAASFFKKEKFNQDKKKSEASLPSAQNLHSNNNSKKFQKPQIALDKLLKKK